MGKATRGLLIFVVAIALAACAGEQNRPPTLPSAQIAAPLKLCTPAAPPADLLANPGFMQFAVSVTESTGKPVMSLKQSDFEARAGGQTLPIQYFREEPDGAPTSIVIVMDLSGLMAGELVPHVSRIEAVQKSLPDSMYRLNECDEIAILVFGGDESADERIGQTPNSAPYQSVGQKPIRLLQPFTTDHRLALMRLADRTTGGLSPLYDAMQQRLNILESAHYQNRALIVITDGVDDASAVRKEDLIASIKKSGVPVYAIELGEPYTPADYPPSGPPAFTIVIPFPSKAANTATGKTTPKKKTPCEKFKCVDTEVLEKLVAPNGGQLLIVPHATYDPRVTLKDELNSTMTSLNHGYAIGVVAPAGLVRPEIVVANRRHVKVRAHVVHGPQ